MNIFPCVAFRTWWEKPNSFNLIATNIIHHSPKIFIDFVYNKKNMCWKMCRNILATFSRLTTTLEIYFVAHIKCNLICIVCVNGYGYRFYIILLFFIFPWVKNRIKKYFSFSRRCWWKIDGMGEIKSNLMWKFLLFWNGKKGVERKSSWAEMWKKKDFL